jgi:hypothetical protein
VKQLRQFSERVLNHRPTWRSIAFWFGLSCALAILYGLWVWQQAFSAEFVIQDDARQHVFWMQRFLDRSLFPQDLIADYFQSVAPIGYTWLYQMAAGLGIHPLLMSKLLPMVLGLLTTIACFGVVLQFFPIPAAAFVASLLLNQVLWMQDDLVSATPRAFIYPLFVSFCYFLLRRSLVPCVGLILLQGWFYPQSVFLSSGLLLVQVIQWQGGRPRLSRSSDDYWFCGIGLVAAVAVMLPYALEISEFGPVITRMEAQQMPEFQRGGRSDFFTENAWKFWVEGLRSGLLPYISRLPELLYVAFLLPVMLRFRRVFPLTRYLQPAIILIPQLLAVSLFWFLVAHVLLFRLHLPSRYTQHSLRLILCWAAGLAIVIGLDGLRRWAIRTGNRAKGVTAKGVTITIFGLVAAALLFYPSYTPEFPRTGYFVGTQPDLYAFLSRQPTQTLVASLSEEANNLPSFTQRSVFVAQEYAIPYHMGYYRPFQQRAIDLIEAQYSPNLPKLKRFIRATGSDFWLLDRDAFTPEYVKKSWFRQYPQAAQPAERSLRAGRRPALAQMIRPCAVAQNSEFILLDAACILDQPNQRQPSQP